MEECPAPPLGITYVAAAFEAAGADVKIIDYIVSRYSSEKLRNELALFKPHVVGATSVTMNFHMASHIMKDVKEYDPTIITIMGGPHVSFDTLNTLEGCPEIDLIVMGEGEKTITELVDCQMERGKWPEIKGLAFLQNGKVIHTGTRMFIDDVDSIPLPARHLLSHSRYQALGYPISIITSRGCPYSCIFCLGRHMVGKKVRRRRASLVVDEMEEILSYGWRRINIADDLFTSNIESVRAICEEIQKRALHFTWSAFARVNSVDKKTLELMKEAGCDSISFGVETGNAEMLKRIRKGITREQVRIAVKLCEEVGIICHASFVVGLPGETGQTLSETRDFARSLNLFYGYHFLAPFPGTTVREEIKQYDLEILTDDWSRYDANSAIVRTSSLSPEEMNRFVAAYNDEINTYWKKLVYGYQKGVNSAEENLRVEGHFRALLVYKLLSEDMIESFGKIQVQHETISFDRMVDCLCRRLAEKTGMERALIEKTIKHFIHAGYLSSHQENGTFVWRWTKNNRGGHYNTRHYFLLTGVPFFNIPMELTIGSSSKKPEDKAIR